MVQLRLPANSRIARGHTWNEPGGAGRWRKFHIYRWLPEAGSLPSLADERLDRVYEPMGVYGCRQILYCAKVCSKGLNPAEAIAGLRRRLVHRQSG